MIKRYTGSADAQAMIDTIENLHNEVADMLQRIRELAVQAANDTNSSVDRTNISTEMTALASEIDAIASNTKWAGQSLVTASGNLRLPSRRRGR